ncbi:MAG: hypothetical protein GYB53_19810, partial [Rhodobacteraceae bacterium]|nr:hypothetical protein [Paracoccaceae bacterium]
MVELAKKLRKQMLAIGVEGFWLEVFNRTIEVFRDHPPENRDTDPTSMLGFLDLLSDEAERMGDTSFLQSLASAQSDLAFQVDWAAADGTQGSLDYSDLLNRSVRFNASMRAGRAFLGEDDKAARAAFERALEISEQDVLKQVDALFELTKLLRNSPTERDFQQALACGEAAVALTKDLLRLGAIDPGKQSDVTLSTSNVYLDIVTLPGIDWPEGLNRGEALGEECLDFAASVGQRARACVNLSNWRR